MNKFGQFKAGDVFDTVALLVEILSKKTKKGSDYLNLGLSDGEQIIHANLWNTNKEQFDFDVNQVLQLTVQVGEFNGGLSYTVLNYSKAEECYKVTDFIKRTPLNPESMYKALIEYLDKFENIKLSELVKIIYEDHKKKLLYWSAAKSVHHDCYGGLLYHVYRMVRTASVIAKIYGGVLNKDLLIAATMLHDIGKIYELETSELGVADYSIQGTLLGHATIGINMIENYARQVDLEEETKLLLQHCISAHHGQIEWGAITAPAIPEACALSYIDNLDAKMYIFEEQYNILENGQISDKIFGLGQRVYKPNSLD